MSASIPFCQHWRSKRDSDDILWLFLDRQGESVNSLSSAVLQEFDSLIAYATQHLPGGVAILSGKSSGSSHETLSNRELLVLKLIASGKSIKEISAELALSVKTVATYRSRIAEKMGLSSNVELTRYAMQHQLVE